MNPTGIDLAVIYTPVGGGHKAAAMATAEAARARGLRVELVDAFEYAPKWFTEAYLTAHFTGQSAVPRFYGSAYFSLNRRGGAFEPMRLGFDQLAMTRLQTAIVAMAPRAVVATHHLPLVVLGRTRRLGLLQAPLIGVVTDYMAHACWAERGVDAFAVPSAMARHDLILHGVDPTSIALTGIPILGSFERIAPVKAPAARDRLRVLVTSGGFGIGPMEAIVASFAGHSDVELTLVCGNAPKLQARVERVAFQLGVPSRVLGFERNMAARMAEAHLVIGKAGGLTVSESMAAGRPMLIVGAVPGNEKVNEQFVVQAGAGYAALPGEAGALAQVIRAQGHLEIMGERARRLVVTRSAPNVVDVAMSMARATAGEHAAA